MTDDREYVKQLLLKAGEENGEDAWAAFTELIESLGGRLTRLAYRHVSSTYIPDLLQETWLAAWEHRGTYRGEAHPLTWLCTIMANVARRNRALRPTANGEHTADDLQDVGSVADIDALLVAASIDSALAKLDPLEAEVIRRRHLAQQTWARIAHDMGFPSPHYAQKAYNAAMRRVKALGKER